MSEQLMERAREGRKSGATLKLKLSNLRSHSPTDIILVFEGIQDYGPYECWLGKIEDSRSFAILCGKGKGQLLDLRCMLARDRTHLRNGVYFLIDHDYDGLRSSPSGADIYVTETYSVENSLVNETVLKSILKDEFQLVNDHATVDALATRFNEAIEQFGNAMKQVNFRIFARSKLSLQNSSSLSDKVGNFVSIDVNKVDREFTDEDLERLIPLLREPTADELTQLSSEFNTFEPLMAYRGKYWMSFFKVWLDRLATIRKNGPEVLVPKLPSLKFTSSKLDMRSLASRCKPPNKFRKFIESTTIQESSTTGR